MKNTTRYWGMLLFLCVPLLLLIAPHGPALASGIVQSAYNLVQDEGSGLARRTILNFVGAGVTAADTGGVTVVTIPGPSGGGTCASLGGDVTGTCSANTVVKVNGVAYSTSPSTDTTPVITASNTATYKALPSCSAAGSTLNYNTSTHAYSCGTVGTLSPTGTLYLTDGTNTYGPTFAMTPPNAISFSWRNQGTATETATGSALFLNTPALANDNIRGREITAPSTPWSITIGFLPQQMAQNFSATGMYVADNGTGKLTILSFSGTSMQVADFTNVTTFSAAPFTQVFGGPGSLVWFKIVDDGTNQTFNWSQDGMNFRQLLSRGRTAFLAAPNRVGYMVNSNNGNNPAAQTLLSWKQGTN